MTLEVNQIKEYLAQPRVIGLFSHRNPDGDALGSTLAMQHLLVQMGHTVKVMVPSEYPQNFEWMPEVDKILVWDLDSEDIKAYTNTMDFAIYLDFNSLDRIDKMGEYISNKTIKTWTIDHHIDPIIISDWIYSVPEASSTSELVWDIIIQFGWQKYLNTQIANCLLTGIITDTGNFAYSVTPDLLNKVAEILKLNVNYEFVQNAIHNTMPEKQLRLLGHCLINRMEIFPQFQAGLIYLDKEDYKNFEIKRGDTEGIVNYLLKLKNIKIAAFITEQPTITKISLRSKGDVNVEVICKEFFKGGGHKNAAGGALYLPLHIVVKILKEALTKYHNI